MLNPQVFGKYLLLNKIAVGGMAEIFKAKSTGVAGFEKTLVIKRILPHFSDNEEFVTMFIDEAKIAGQLNHANIVQIFDLGRVGKNYYIAMEYIHGRDLRTIIKAGEKAKKSLSIEHSVFIIIEVLKALDFAHRKKDSKERPLNIIHRDISPQNILLSFEGEVKLTDFGIAKATTKASETQAGVLKGKFAYMSPEQASGKRLNQQSDLFSVGIILYELLTQTRLFLAKTDFATLEKVREARIDPPSMINPKIPKSLDKIVIKALQKKLEKRYATAQEFQEDLTKFLYSSSTFSLDKLNPSSYLKELFAAEIQKDLEEMKEEEKILEEFRKSGQIQISQDSESFQATSAPSPSVLKSEEQNVEEVEKEKPETPIPREIKQGKPFFKQLVNLIVLSLLFTIIELGALFGYTLYNKETKLKLITEPQDAQVYLDKRLEGNKTPITLTLNRGTIHIINIIKKGYKKESLKLVVTSKKPIEEKITLKPLGAKSDSKKDATSKEPPTIPPVKDAQKITPSPVPTKPSTELATPSTGEGITGSVDKLAKQLQKSGEISKPTTLQEFGELSVNVNPWANVYLDDKPIGNTPIVKKKIPIGPHKLTLKHPMYNKEKVYDINITKDNPVEIVYDWTQ